MTESSAPLKARAARVGLIMLLTFAGQQLLTAALLSLLTALRLIDRDAEWWGLSNSGYLFCHLMVYLVAIGLPLYLSILFLKPRSVRSCPHRRLPPLNTALVIGAAIGACFLCNALLAYFSSMLYTIGVPQPPVQESLDDSLASLLLNLLVMAVVPAILEELLVRGVVLQCLRPFGNITAVLTSALFFGLLHGNWLQLLYGFALGVLLGFLVLQTGSLPLCMVIHGGGNALAITVNHLTRQLVPEQQAAALAVCTAVITLIGLFCFGILLLRQREDAPLLVFPKEKQRPTVLWTAPLFLVAIIAITVWFVPLSLT